MRTLRESYINQIYMGSKKRQDLLSKLGAWGPWEMVEEEGKGMEGVEKNVNNNNNNNNGIFLMEVYCRRPEIKELSPSSFFCLFPELGCNVSSLHPGPLPTFSLPTAMSSLQE